MLMAVLSVPGLIDLLKLENADYLRDQGRELSGKNRAFLFLFAVASAVVGYGFIYIQAFVGGRFLKSSGHDLTGTQLGLGVPGFAISERADSPTMTSKVNFCYSACFHHTPKQHFRTTLRIRMHGKKTRIMFIANTVMARKKIVSKLQLNLKIQLLSKVLKLCDFYMLQYRRLRSRVNPAKSQSRKKLRNAKSFKNVQN